MRVNAALMELKWTRAAPPLPSLPQPLSKAANVRATRNAKRSCALPCGCFWNRGYHRATLNDVAERLNITKPALYNYFRSKDEILYECWALGQERVEELIADIDARGGSGLLKLRKLVHAYAEIMATDFGASLVRFDSRDLTDKNRVKSYGPQKIHRHDISQLHQ